MADTWIVVADKSRARIFAAANAHGAWRELDDLVHPESRLHDRDLGSDTPGRTFDSIGQGRHAMEPSQAPKRHEAEVFARQIGQHLNAARAKNEFDELVLMAAPAFLGLLRDQLDAETAKHVARSIAKNVTAHSTDELRAYYFEHR